MSNEKWDKKYLTAADPGEAVTVLTKNLHLLPDNGRAIDVACGLGANALLMAEQGLQVDAWDYSSVALDRLNQFARQKNLAINTRLIDLETREEWQDKFDVIVVSNFLFRPLAKQICLALNSNGLLFYETFTQQKCGDHGPSNPEFLLAKNELLSLFIELKPVIYSEERDCGDISQGFRNKAFLIARKD